MRYRYYESNSPKRVGTYLFYVVLVLWFLATGILGYQFLLQNSETTTKKGGTFVEAIFDHVSYLPYLKNDWQSMFYQSFLFDSCLDYTQEDPTKLESNWCEIQTEDYQTYYVSLTGEQKQRSDQRALTIDDLLFTYGDVIARNERGIRSLSVFQEVQVSLEEERVKVVFPSATTDNTSFFAAYILPRHVLAAADFESYRTIFAANPITSSCGKISPKTSDNQSLVFDLTKCEDTNLAYYQIKNYEGFEKFTKTVLEQDNTLIDVYPSPFQLSGYTQEKVISSQLLTLFFNTKSNKMKVRFRRAFGGLMNSQFYIGDYGKYLKKYTDPLLAQFVSDGSNIKEFINRLSSPEEGENVQQEDLRDSGIQQLKKSISINGVERKFVFYLQKPENNIFNLEIKFSNQFENIKVTDANKNTFSPKNYNKLDKKIVYPLEFGKNLKEGLNQYTIVGTIKGKTYTIAYIDLYLLGASKTAGNAEDAGLENKIKVVYYNSLESNFAIQKMREILTQHEVLSHFLFEQVSSPEELEAKLVVGDYDILLNTIHVGMKRDILKILTTQDPLVNPSKYTNPNLTQLFKQYTKASNKAQFLEQINQQFAQDMPLVILGYPFEFVNIKNNLWGSGMIEEGQFLHEYTWRKHLYQHVTLMQTRVIDFSKLRDVRGFVDRILPHLRLENPFASSENQVENLTTDEETEISAENAVEETVAGESAAAQETQETQETNSVSSAQSATNSDDPFGGLIQPAGA